jgi:hypothetical protein
VVSGLTLRLSTAVLFTEELLCPWMLWLMMMDARCCRGGPCSMLDA